MAFLLRVHFMYFVQIMHKEDTHLPIDRWANSCHFHHWTFSFKRTKKIS